jgi:2,4-dienoyl-CoA reductase-like NADH-dependent reductase (Old Yellow Enzyme family)
MPTVKSAPEGPFGRNLPLSRTIRSAVRAAGFQTPIGGAGGINSFEIAERALRDGDCDFVGAARQSLADPDWWRKIEEGRGGEIRRCIYTNYCEGHDQRHHQVTCQLWDRDFELGDPGAADGSIRRSEDGKRRLVPPPWS